LRETRLRWFEHVRRRNINAPVRRCETIDLLHCRRRRGRPTLSWSEVIRSDLKFIGLTEDVALDRSMWRSKIKVVDHKQRT